MKIWSAPADSARIDCKWQRNFARRWFPGMDQLQQRAGRKRFRQILYNNSCSSLLREFNITILATNAVVDIMRNMMKAISRRRFLQVAAATMLVAALPASGGARSRRGEKRIRVRPLASQGGVSAAERAFCQRARFASAADAMRAAASRGMTAEIYVE